MQAVPGNPGICSARLDPDASFAGGASDHALAAHLHRPARAPDRGDFQGRALRRRSAGPASPTGLGRIGRSDTLPLRAPLRARASVLSDGPRPFGPSFGSAGRRDPEDDHSGNGAPPAPRSMRDDVELVRTRFLRGPNIWTFRSVLETWIDLHAYEARPSNTIEGFTPRLTAWLPGLIEHQCGVGERGGFLQRLDEGTWLGHVLEHIVIELLNLAGLPTGFGQTRSTSTPGVYRMVFRARDERSARVALEQGHALMMAAVRDQPFDTAAAVEKVHDALDRWYFGPSTASIVGAATERGIPHIRLNDGNLVQLGYGARSRRIWTAETDATSAVAESIAGDKPLTKQLIAAAGVPVPEGSQADSPDAAWEIAQELGLPVCIKPTDGNHGRGVAIGLSNEADVRSAWAVAEAEGSGVLVERSIPGHEHRLLVVGDRVVAATRGDIAAVTADGSSTVLQLVDAQLNTDERRGDSERHPLSKLRLVDEPAIMAELARQGLTPESVPAAGRHVIVQRNGNLSVDCTDEVHPQVARMVALAARTVGLDIAGVDVVATDIGQPLRAQRGAIVEVNAGPGLLMHLKPAVGTPRPVGRAIVDRLFGPDDAEADSDGSGRMRESTGRIPIVGITGGGDTAPAAALVAWLLQLAGRHTGLATREGLTVDRRRIEACDGTQWDAAERLLINPVTTAAVFQHTPRSILADGLPYDRCRVGVVTDLDGHEHLAEFDVRSPEAMPRVMRTQVDVVLDDGFSILNGAREDVAALARHSDGEVLLYAADLQAPAMFAHRAAGGRTIGLRGREIVLVDGASPIADSGDTGERIAEPASRTIATLPPARRRIATDDALIMAACGMVLGIAPELIGAALATYGD